jgi:hypothetical protein
MIVTDRQRVVDEVLAVLEEIKKIWKKE